MVEKSRSNFWRSVNRLAIAGLSLVVFSCAGLCLFGDRPTNGIRVERLEADLNEKLPNGSTWAQAEAWFASHGIRTGTIAELGGPIVGLSARIPNDSLLEYAEIRIELLCDTEGRLQKRHIHRFVYSF